LATGIIRALMRVWGNDRHPRLKEWEALQEGDLYFGGARRSNPYRKKGRNIWNHESAKGRTPAQNRSPADKKGGAWYSVHRGWSNVLHCKEQSTNRWSPEKKLHLRATPNGTVAQPRRKPSSPGESGVSHRRIYREIRGAVRVRITEKAS